MNLFRFRLLPFTILVAFLSLGLKVGEVMRDSKQIIVSLSNSAQAESTPDPAAPAKPEDSSKAPAAAGAMDAKPAKPDTDTKTAAPAAPEAKPATADTSGEDEDKQNKHEYSQVEVDLLQSLAQRRQELDNWGKQVQLKETMLAATELRINEKIDNLQKMKKELEDLLAKYNEVEDAKIRSLVKIYENMKPKDAARIFEELDMPILLTVVDRMSERKVSPILSYMSPTRAKDLTVQLAENRKLQKPRASTYSGNEAATGGANTGGGADSSAAQPPATR